MKIFAKILTFIACAGASVACQDLKFGNDFLEKAPGVDITIDTVFSCKKYADRALNAAYQSIPCGLILSNTAIDGESGTYDYRMNESSIGADNQDAITDILQTSCEWGGLFGMYYNGGYTAASENDCGHTKFSYMNGLNFVWMGIRRAYIYLDNVDRVPDMTEEEKTLRKAEAKLIIAINYMVALRHLGGIPILYDAIDASNSDVDLSRKSVQEVLDHIIKLCDEAAKDLPWQVSRSDFGRVSKGAAYALKARILLFCASPLFNAPQPFKTPLGPTAQNIDKFKGDKDLMVWLGGYNENRWKAAADACQAFLDENDASPNPYALVTASGNEPTPEEYRAAFSKCYGDRCNGEVILSGGHVVGMFKSAYYTQYMGCSRHFTYGTNGEQTTGVGYGGGDTTLEYVDMFPNIDGTPSSYVEWLHNGREVVEHEGRTCYRGSIDDTPFLNKDPRLYESVTIVGDRFRDYRVETWIGGEERGELGGEGHVTSLNCRKFLWDYDMDSYGNKPFCWPVFRMAEIYLNYAEALNELGRFDEACEMLNKTRRRVGLPDMTRELLDLNQPDSKFETPLMMQYEQSISFLRQDKYTMKLREEILDERAREFMIEDCRWFDIARWKHGDILKKHLHGILMFPTTYSPDDAKKPKDAYLCYGEKACVYEIDFSEPEQLYERAWQLNGDQLLDPKWYLSAFPTDEINKGTGLTQNPGWDK